MRAGAFLDAASRLGPTDVFGWVRDRADVLRRRHEQIEGAHRSLLSRRATVSSGLSARVRWLTGSAPLDVAGREVATARQELLAFRRWHYDLTVLVGSATWQAFADLVEGPTVLDFTDLEHTRVRSRVEMLGSGPADAMRRTQASIDARRWERVERAAAAAATVTTVCSHLDAERLGVPGAIVVPNGYPEPSEPAGRVPIGDPPTITFVGAMSYPPNADAAGHLISDVAPRLFSRHPTAEIRIVGSAAPTVTALGEVDRVTVTGYVPDLSSELCRADVLVVPVRAGGGTRIKVLEAFAHRIPLVATPLGVEGIDARHDEHLLVADDPDEFARHVCRLLSEEDLRSRLTEAAHELFERRYRWSAITDALEAVLGRAAES